MSDQENPRIWVQYNPKYSKPYDLVGICIWEEVLTGMTEYYPKGKGNMPFEKLSMYAGENKTIRVYIKDRDMNPVNVLGSSCVLTVKEKKTDTSATIQKTAGGATGGIGAADEGEIFFFLIPTDTSSLATIEYVFDVKATLSNGKVYTVLEGTLKINDPVN